MAKGYYLSDEDLRFLKWMRRNIGPLRSSAGGRRSRRTRRWGAGGVTNSSLAIAMITADVAAYSAIDGSAFTCTPGKTADAATILQWNKDGSDLYTFPLTSFEPEQEEDPGDPPNLIDVVRAAINVSGTTVRASVGEPIVLVGSLDLVKEDGDEEEVFIISNIMDFRALPGFVKGSTPGGSDDPDLQIPFHSGGSIDFKQNSEDCAAP